MFVAGREVKTHSWNPAPYKNIPIDSNLLDCKYFK